MFPPSPPHGHIQITPLSSLCRLLANTLLCKWTFHWQTTRGSANDYEFIFGRNTLYQFSIRVPKKMRCCVLGSDCLMYGTFRMSIHVREFLRSISGSWNGELELANCLPEQNWRGPEEERLLRWGEKPATRQWKQQWRMWEVTSCSAKSLKSSPRWLTSHQWHQSPDEQQQG